MTGARYKILFLVMASLLLSFGCGQKIEIDGQKQNNNNQAAVIGENLANNDNQNSSLDNAGVRIIFLHHSTGQNIWDGGLAEWLASYNDQQGTNYQITAQDFPQDSPYGWENYPYDYWNIWVNHGGQDYYLEEPTLQTLTKQYEVIIWKHCFPVSDIEADIGQPDVRSSDKRLENYKLQYKALKQEMYEFPATKFIVWTAAAQTKKNTEEAYAQRAKELVAWVKDEWDEPGDNIFLWDFYQLETEGGLYLKNEYAVGRSDSHPNAKFAQQVAPLLGQRIIEVITDKAE